MLCSRCKKRPATIFITTNKEADKSQGLCFQCASELGIKPLNNLMNQLGITSEDIENMSEQFEALSEEYGDEMDPDNMEDGAIPFPFMKSLFSVNPFESVNVENEPGKDKKSTSGRKNKKRKNL